MKKLLIGITLALFLCAGFATGCSPARKPAPSPTRTTPSTPSTPSAPAKKITRTTTDKQKAERAAKEATKVPGVRKATVVISGRTAFIGLDLSAKEGTATTKVKSDVAKRVKAAEPSLTTVNVTSDPDLVTRLRKVAEGIKSGKPVSSFSSELTEIGRKIKPQMR